MPTMAPNDYYESVLKPRLGARIASAYRKAGRQGISDTIRAMPRSSRSSGARGYGYLFRPAERPLLSVRHAGTTSSRIFRCRHLRAFRLTYQRFARPAAAVDCARAFAAGRYLRVDVTLTPRRSARGVVRMLAAAQQRCGTCKAPRETPDHSGPLAAIMHGSCNTSTAGIFA